MDPVHSTPTHVLPKQNCEEAGWGPTIGTIHNHPAAEACAVEVHKLSSAMWEELDVGRQATYRGAYASPEEKQRRHDEFISVQTEIIEHETTQLFNLARFRRQYIGDIFGQKPIRHEGARYGRKLKKCIMRGSGERARQEAEPDILRENTGL